MRILLLASSDLNSCLNLNYLLSRLSEKHDIRVMQSNYELKNERGNIYADTKIWYEKDFIQKHFFPLIDAQRHIEDTTSPALLTFNGLQKKYNLHFTQLLPKTAKQAILDKTLAFKPHTIICCRFDYILPETIFSMPPLGSYNTHSGLLPQCAGADATFWTMYHGLTTSGCTIHAINNEVDKGNIISKAHFSINYNYGVLWNRTKAYSLGVKIIEDMVAQLESGKKLEEEVQRIDEYTYYPFPCEKDFSTLYTQKKLDESHGYAQLLQDFLPKNMSIPDTTPILS